MGAVPIHLAKTHAPRMTVPATFPTVRHLRAWLPAALLLLSLSVLCLNQPWLTSLCLLAPLLTAGIMAMLTPSAAMPRRTLPLLLAAAIPLWGAANILLGHTAYNYAALLSVLYWTTLPACLLLGALMLRERSWRDAFLASLWLLAAAVISLELYQILIVGRYNVLPSGYPLMSSNLYAELAELLLPAVLATALRNGSRLWLGAILCALLLGTAVAAGARMGTALLLLETVAVFLATRNASGYRALTWRKHGLALCALLVATLALEGTTYLNSRVHQQNLLEGRSDVTRSALLMARQHPATGFGMGAFPIVYPAYERLDTASFVNHVHDDYLEMAVDGGLPALLLWFALVAVSLPAVFKAPWAFGTCAILVHSTTDFPLYRLPVLALLALLFAAAASRKAEHASRSTTRPERPGSLRTSSQRAA